jgi:hypothetical protein
MPYYVELFAASALASSLVFRGIMNRSKEATIVRSKKDGREYVVRDIPDKPDAADLLADINKTVTAFIARLVDDHPGDARVRRIKRRFNPNNVSEGSHRTGYTSYSQNKGEKIVVCLRQTDDSFVAKNELMYVVIHELGHLSTDDVGHTDEFWDNFRWLVHKAIRYGMYKHVDYATHPSPYCGIDISSNVVAAGVGMDG